MNENMAGAQTVQTTRPWLNEGPVHARLMVCIAFDVNKYIKKNLEAEQMYCSYF